MSISKNSNVFSALSCGCSLFLIPVALFGDTKFFYVFIVLNFILFHSIWISKTLAGRQPFKSNAFFKEEVRIPLILFAICGAVAWWLVDPNYFSAVR